MKSGAFQQAAMTFTEKFKPEATYFFPDEGMRSGIFIFDLQGSHQLPEISEPFFDLGYKVIVTPCMTPDDLRIGFGAAGL